MQPQENAMVQMDVIKHFQTTTKVAGSHLWIFNASPGQIITLLACLS